MIRISLPRRDRMQICATALRFIPYDLDVIEQRMRELTDKGCEFIETIRRRGEDYRLRPSDGMRRCPPILHRVLFGSLERCIGILIEHGGGAFSLALPQAVALNIGEARTPGLAGEAILC